MISFYPGPSKVWDRLPHYMQDAWRKGILSVNHRSPEFIEVAGTTLRLLHKKLHIPENYKILFTSSATESWEIIAQSIIGKSKSLHLYNGAFGEKWFEYTKKITENAIAQPFEPESLPEPSTIKADSDTLLLALTHNETSNGTALPDRYMKEIRGAFPEQLIAVDATSSMGGVNIPFETADVWFASVQKCFGLPSGLGLLVCSPRAVTRAEELGENKHYNSLLYMLRMISEDQTTYTPNVLGIYLLMRSLQDSLPINKTALMLNESYESWVQFFEGGKKLSLLIQNQEVRSQTVITVKGNPTEIQEIKGAAKTAGFYLGNGYGKWKDDTFRIANFPAHTEEEVQQLKSFIKAYIE